MAWPVSKCASCCQTARLDCRREEKNCRIRKGNWATLFIREAITSMGRYCKKLSQQAWPWNASIYVFFCYCRDLAWKARLGACSDSWDQTTPTEPGPPGCHCGFKPSQLGEAFEWGFRNPGDNPEGDFTPSRNDHDCVLQEEDDSIRKLSLQPRRFETVLQPGRLSLIAQLI